LHLRRNACIVWLMNSDGGDKLLMLTEAEKIRKLPWQLAANSANMLFCYTTFFGSVFMLFLNELGMDKSRIGTILSFFPFCCLTALFTAPFIARCGFKRIFLLFYSLRIIFVIAVIPIAWILESFGPEKAFLWIATNIFLYALCKAIAETALFPWYQEIIPNSIRGRFNAINTVIQMIFSIVITASVGYVVGRFHTISRFTTLMTVGLIGGVLSTWFFNFCPGGAPAPDNSPDRSRVRDMLNPLKDKKYAEFNTGLLMVTLAWAFITAFTPLYLKEEVGLSNSVIVWLDIVNFLGCIASSYFWGWASDRYGSRSVMMLGPIMLIAFPVLCFFMPRGTIMTLPIAALTIFMLGCASIAWGIGSNRYLYVTAVPAERKTSYIAVYYANVGLAGGLGPIIAGKTLQLSSGVKAMLAGRSFDQYTVVFVVGLAALIIGMCTLRVSLHGNEMSTRKMLTSLIGDYVLSFARPKPIPAAPIAVENNEAPKMPRSTPEPAER
jgi:predicted MFS family arabinose efflux permease